MDNMDFTSAMETFAEAWVATNTRTAITDQTLRHATPLEELPTMVNKESSAQGLPYLLPLSSSRSKSHDPMTSGHATKHKSRTPPPPSSTQEGSCNSIPIRCMVEQSSRINTPSSGDKHNRSSSGGSTIELDTYAILPASSLFSEIVRVALVKVGYTSAEAIGAKGVIQIKNWKALTFDTITDKADATVEEILGDLTSIVTLRIKLGRRMDNLERKEWKLPDVRSAVIELLREMNQCKLAKLSPLSQSLISNIANSRKHISLSTDKCVLFGDWYRNYRLNQQEEEVDDSGGFDNKQSDKRMTFHPVYEIPMMREWFFKDRNPTDESLIRHLTELNEGAMRKERGVVTLYQLKNWWKNERQREKRIQNREMDKASQSVNDKQEDKAKRSKMKPTVTSETTSSRVYYSEESNDTSYHGYPSESGRPDITQLPSRAHSNMTGRNDPLLGQPSTEGPHHPHPMHHHQPVFHMGQPSVYISHHPGVLLGAQSPPLPCSFTSPTPLSLTLANSHNAVLQSSPPPGMRSPNSDR